MKTDRALQKEVLFALTWEPDVKATHIRVSVDGGVVTLQGAVTTYYQKLAANRAVRRVCGVRAVANDLVVNPTPSTRRTDVEIAKAVAKVLRGESAVPPGTVSATVDDGWVTLTGTVVWPYQRMAAEAAVEDLYGVKGVNNSIGVYPPATADELEETIEATLACPAEIDARDVHVEARGGTVILTGRVHSLFERDEVERVAWSAPGVRNVEDRLQVCA
jgi:osmotically-inducible protein OsmY